MTSLAGKRILITGAAGNVGAACVRAVRDAGGTAIATDLIAGTDILPLDVSSESDWQRILQPIAADSGLDGLVNAAGIAVRGDIAQLDLATWRKVMAVNLDGAFLGCKFALPLMQNGGSIVNIASVLGLVANANLAAYSASKGGLRMLTRAVALHGATLRPQVRCNAVCPAFLEGTMVDAMVDSLPYPDVARQVMAREIPAGRFGRADEIARACLYLLSDDAAFVTGTDIVIDGGMTAR